MLTCLEALALAHRNTVIMFNFKTERQIQKNKHHNMAVANDEAAQLLEIAAAMGAAESSASTVQQELNDSGVT